MNTFWFWLQVVVAAVCVGLSAWAWVGVIAELDTWVFTFAQVITALFFLSGVALTLIINTILLARRNPPRTTTVGERVTVGIAIGLLALTVVIGLFDEASWIAFFTWPFIVVAAILSTAWIIVGTVRAKTPASPVPWETPPPSAA